MKVDLAPRRGALDDDSASILGNFCLLDANVKRTAARAGTRRRASKRHRALTRRIW
jgi:hypothetical protein